MNQETERKEGRKNISSSIDNKVTTQIINKRHDEFEKSEKIRRRRRTLRRKKEDRQTERNQTRE